MENDDQAEFSIDSIAHNENTGAMMFTVSLSHPVDVPVSLTATTANGTAMTADSDYTANSQVLTFAAGEVTKTFTVQVTADDKVEDNETFSVQLGSLNANGRNVVISPTANTGSGTIVNDDQTLFSIASVRKNEGDSATTTFTFTVTLSHPSESSVSVDYGTAEGTAFNSIPTDHDYNSASGTLTFSPGGPLTQTVTVAVAGDTAVETDETFTVTLSNPRYASVTDLRRVDLDAAAFVGTGTIVNDDTATLAINSPSITEGNSGTQTLTFNVTVDKAVEGGFTVAFRSAGVTATVGSDYLVSTVTPLTFSGTVGESHPIQVTIYGDQLVEGDETFTITLGAVNPALAVTTGAVGTGTIQNDDSAEFEMVGNMSVTEGNAAVFTILLTHAVDVETSVTVTTADDHGGLADHDYLPLSAYVVTFPAGSTSQVFTVQTTADNKVEADETFIATLGDLNNGGRGVTIPSVTNFATGRILNDDSAVISIAGVSLAEGNSGAALRNLFVISLTNPVDVAVTVEFSTQDGAATAPTDYTAQSSVLVTIPANTISVTHSVEVIGDLSLEPDETVHGSIANLLAVGRNVSLGTSTATATILNDDNAPTVTSFVRQVPQAALTHGNSVTFRATFSEDVVHVDVGDFAWSGTAAGDGKVANVSVVSASVYDVTVTGLTSSNGTVNLNLVASPTIDNLWGIALTNGTPTGADETYTIDNLAPTGISVVRKNLAAEVTNATTVTFRVTFSEDVQNLGLNDLAFTGAAGSYATASGLTPVTGSSVFDLTVNVPLYANGLLTLVLAPGATIDDRAGNALSTTGSPPNPYQSYTIDHTTTPVYVNGSWRSTPLGAAPAGESTLIFGYNAFAEFPDALGRVARPGTIHVMMVGTADNESLDFASVNSGDEAVVHRLGWDGSFFDVFSDVMVNLSADGAGGSDTVTLTDETGGAVATLSPGSGTVTGLGYAVTLQNVETINAIALSGGQAFLYDSAGDDTFEARPESVSLTGAGFHDHLTGFTHTYAYARNGGTDTALLYDSAGNDTFQADGNANGTRLMGPGIDFYAEGFDRT
ncbi:MAG: hypothetical protein NTY19_21325 [Planctomycetota bacterium]|nr:hypothetical protein [Planctomycetota bacterium]